MSEHWIRLVDRKPEWMQKCLVYHEDGSFYTETYYEDGFLFEHLYGRVTHWQPLEPPKKAGEAIADEA